MMQLNRYKATFGRHETFPLRYGWLPRGLEAREQNPASFSPPKQAMITRGVGRDRVNCIQYWLQAAGQVEIDSVCIGVRDGRNHVYRDRGQTRPVRYHRQAQARLCRPTRPSAVRNNIPDAIPIIAVYLRVTETDHDHDERQSVRRRVPPVDAVGIVLLKLAPRAW